MLRQNKKLNQKQKRRISWRMIAGFVILFILIAGGVTAGLYCLMPRSEQESVVSEESEGIEAPLSDLDVEDKAPEQFEGPDPNQSEALTGTITYASVTGNYLHIRVNIDQFISGNCHLNLTIDGRMIHTEDVEIVDSASTSTCAGFDIPASKLDTGIYGIEIKLHSGDKAGIIFGEVKI